MEQSNIHSKKRKIFRAEDDDDDEEKIEKFFALIRTMREARDRLLADRGVTKGGSKRSKIEATRMPTPVLGWKPTFELEDFMHDARMIGENDPPANGLDTPRRVGSELDHREMKVSLDLTLSL